MHFKVFPLSKGTKYLEFEYARTIEVLVSPNYLAGVIHNLCIF